MKLKHIILVFSTAFLMLVVACGGSAEPVPQPTYTAYPTYTPVPLATSNLEATVETKVKTVAATATPEPTPSPIVKAKATNSPPPTPTPTPTPTSVSLSPGNTPSSNDSVDSTQSTASNSRYPAWEKNCTGSGTVKFANSPMRIEDINFLSPYGDIVGGHITPIDHMYFEVKDRSLGRNVYEVRAIQDAVIYDISPRDISAETNKATPRDWRLDMGHTCTFASYFDLMTSVVPEIEQAWEKYLKVDRGDWNGFQVQAGQLLGYVGGQSLDFGVYDWAIELPGLINPDAYAMREPWKTHTVDPFQYFPSEISEALLAKMTRVVDPRAGKIDYDVEGTLSGNWFQEGTDWYNGINQMKYWEGHLSIAPHQIDPTLWRIGIGFLDVDDNNFIINGKQDPLLVSSSSGPVTYELQRYMVYIPAKPDRRWWSEPYMEGDIFGVKIFPDFFGTVLVELQDERTLHLEVFKGKHREEIAGFTGESRTYQR